MKQDIYLLFGISASQGRAEGIAHILEKENLDDVEFSEGGILISRTTSPEMVPYMSKSKGIITSEGGLLSHASVVARELGIPCIVGVNGVNNIIKNLDYVEMNSILGQKGEIKYSSQR